MRLKNVQTIMYADKIVPIIVGIVVVIGEVVFTLLTEFMVERIIIDMFLIFLSWSIPRLLTDLKFRKHFTNIMNLDRKIVDITNTAFRNNIKMYRDDAIDDLNTLLTDIRNGVADLDDQQYNRFILILFKTRERYDAMDVSLPSQYVKRNPGYLDAHKEALEGMDDIMRYENSPNNVLPPDKNSGHRIIMRSQSELEDDSKFEAFSKFWQWHKDNNVALKYLSPMRAQKIISENGLEPTDCEQGIAIWRDQFAILFGRRIDPNPDSSEPSRTRVRIISRDRTEFKRVKKISSMMITESVVMMRDATPKIMAKKMVDLWRDYVNPEKRWSTIQPFLYHFLDRYRQEEKRVIDIAGGMGVEYYNMMKDGFDISVNEVQDELRECGEKYRRSNGYETEYRPLNYSWLKMDMAPDRGKFYGLFALGNSLRMLGTADVQEDALRKFMGMMKPGGTIIVDERNYGIILNNADKINQLGMNKGDTRLFAELNDILHQTPNPMYHGTNIGSMPYNVDRDRNLVSFCYYENVEGIQSLLDAEQHRIQDWEFRHDRTLEEMLSNSGFVNIAKYADYDLNKKIELGKGSDDVSMYVFVANSPS